MGEMADYYMESQLDYDYEYDMEYDHELDYNYKKTKKRNAFDFSKIHTTKEGNEINIIDMEDAHLLNTIKFMLKNFRKYKALLNNRNEFNKVYRNETIDYEKAEKYIKYFDLLISRYVMEAVIRKIDLEFFSNQMYEITERELYFKSKELEE